MPNLMHCCFDLLPFFPPEVTPFHMLFQFEHQTQDNNDILSYWLSNASTLLLLLQRTLKASGAAGMAPQRRRSSSATLFGRMTQACISL